MRKNCLTILGITVSLLFFSCPATRDPIDIGVLRATAQMQSFGEVDISGTIDFSEVIMHGTHIFGDIQGLEPNRIYAIHIHEFGSCEDPDAPGGHFDPGESGTHGPPGLSPGAGHAGDLPNIIAGPGGIARIDFVTNALGLRDSDFSVIGRTIVLHSDEDDFTTQPDGGAGIPLACGIIEPVEEEQ
ncbi:superoxide dismutase family protein [Chitinispirillales bacterium ANBcel5]|uniref:superoxide dismutase family protein n=1 Tax=Cellulosispirillum alkaliphilum TaxID=3039283 RepID=UPI002A591007|nr:superoxide dismutase family protein [Chitinispirillales bacterium ANBcel5]